MLSFRVHQKANELTAGNAAIVPLHCEQLEGHGRPCMRCGQWLRGPALIYTGIPAGLQPKCKTRFTRGGPLAHHNGTVPRALMKETEWKRVREIKESSRSHFGYWLASSGPFDLSSVGQENCKQQLRIILWMFFLQFFSPMWICLNKIPGPSFINSAYAQRCA